VAEIKKFQGDLFWNSEDMSDSVEPEEEMENFAEGDIVEFTVAQTLPQMYGVVINDEARFFETEEEAEAARVTEGAW
jgi:hypothetical protein